MNTRYTAKITNQEHILKYEVQIWRTAHDWFASSDQGIIQNYFLHLSLHQGPNSRLLGFNKIVSSSSSSHISLQIGLGHWNILHQQEIQHLKKSSQAYGLASLFCCPGKETVFRFDSDLKQLSKAYLFPESPRKVCRLLQDIGNPGTNKTELHWSW